MVLVNELSETAIAHWKLRQDKSRPGLQILPQNAEHGTAKTYNDNQVNQLLQPCFGRGEAQHYRTSDRRNAPVSPLIFFRISIGGVSRTCSRTSFVTGFLSRLARRSRCARGFSENVP